MLLIHSLTFLTKDTDSSSAVKELMQRLDENKDGKVSFQEYMSLIGYLANSLSESKAQTQMTTN